MLLFNHLIIMYNLKRKSLHLWFWGVEFRWSHGFSSPMEATFAMYDERGELAPSSGIYMAAKGVNTLFVYNSRNAIRRLGLYKTKQQVLFLKWPTNELAACYIDSCLCDVHAFPKQPDLRFQTIEEAELGRWLSFDSKITAMVKP